MRAKGDQNMWWKSKGVLFSLCFQLMFLAFFSFGGAVKAEKNMTDGFIIEADRVVGSGMFASVVKQETSTNDGKPMLRLYYKSATIYGMKLTKQVDTPKGAVSITLTAKGPVTVKGMTVDTTAISFKGACVKASETVPEVGMENVVMVAHYMNTEDSDIENLIQNIVLGKTETSKPSQLQFLQDLSALPLNQLDKEIEKISSGHLPLTCEEGGKDGQSSEIGKITDPIKEVIAGVTNPLDPVLKPLEPVVKPLEPVLKPLEPVLKPLEPVIKPLEPVLKPLDPVVKQVEPVLKPLDPVKKTLEPVLKPLAPIIKPLNPTGGGGGTTETVGQTLQSACVRIKDGEGVITKELALDLIDEAIDKKLTLTTICQNDSLVTTELQKWETGLLKSLGPLNLLGKLIPQDPNQQLYQFRDKIVKEGNGAIIFKP